MQPSGYDTGYDHLIVRDQLFEVQYAMNCNAVLLTEEESHEISAGAMWDVLLRCVLHDTVDRFMHYVISDRIKRVL